MLDLKTRPVRSGALSSHTTQLYFNCHIIGQTRYHLQQAMTKRSTCLKQFFFPNLTKIGGVHFNVSAITEQIFSYIE